VGKGQGCHWWACRARYGECEVKEEGGKKVVREERKWKKKEGNLARRFGVWCVRRRGLGGAGLLVSLS